MFLLKAEKSHLKVEECEMLVSGAQNLYFCQFSFDEAWEGLTPTIVFRTNNAKVSVALNQDRICPIPYEVLETPQQLLQIGVYGIKNGTLILPTLWADLGLIHPGTTLGEDALSPQPSIYEQILETIRLTAEDVRTIREDADNGLFNGERGPQGIPGNDALLTGQEISYQVSGSGTTVPTGSWSRTIPAASQGDYLWTRTALIFNSGEPVVSYTVSRMGRDGSGSLSTINDILPDAEGNINLTAAHVGALPVSGGAMTGAINMQGQVLRGLNAPTANDQPATKGYVDGKTIQTDTTLTIAGAAADARAVGNRFLEMHPVGSLYWSTEDTSPASLFGGTWERIKDRFILAAGDTHPSGSMGGEETHKLTVSEMPSHAHTIRGVNSNAAVSASSGNYPSQIAADKADNWTIPEKTMGKNGGSNPHNNMPPYLTAYCWKRTA